MRLTLYTKLLLAFLLVAGLVGLASVLTGLSFLDRTVRAEALLRVELDLGGAWAAFDRERSHIQVVVSMAAQSASLRHALDAGAERGRAERELEALRRRYDLDWLGLTDADGVVAARAQPPYARGDDRADDPLVARALRGRGGAGPLAFEAERLRREGDGLAERAFVELVPTERAAPTARRFENRGLVVEAALPLLDPHGRVLGAVYGGVLLNRKLDFVDRIRDVVFGERTYAGRPVGTVTLFLGDVRVATNVMLDPSTRALGTRVSREVEETVLRRGRRFADRAFVVNDWYLSAYDPIRDPEGRVVGIIYVGLLEKTYLAYGAGLARRYVGVSLLALLLSVGVALYLSSGLRRPVARLVEATRLLSAGKLDTRVVVDHASLEHQELARAFNAMADALERRSRELETASEALGRAYAEAAEKNRAYLETLGFVTHELKSPLASIVFGIGSLRERLLGGLTTEQEAVLRSIAGSADYLTDTIANYLNLARIEEGDLRLTSARLALGRRIVRPLLERLAELLSEHGVRVENDVPDAFEVYGDEALLGSVMQNLVSNAVKYGREGGSIRLRAEARAGEALVAVWNEGPGFEPADTERLFEKFSRLAEGRDTKAGTGVGLYVARRIVEKHGGRLSAHSKPGNWAEFVFTLPAPQAPASSAEPAPPTSG